MKVKLRMCSLARKHHSSSCRSFAHVFHYRNSICVVPAFSELPLRFRAGILLHELGHLEFDSSEKHSEDDADRMGYLISGVPVQRLNYRAAKNLEVVAPRDLQRALRFLRERIE
jgi:hypothetical protein